MQLPTDIVLPAVIGMGALFVMLRLMGVVQGATRRNHPRHAWRPRVVHDRYHAPSVGRVPDAADQLRSVENASYMAQPLLRHQESKVFAAAEAAVQESGVPWRVFAQVSLGEVLTCPDREGFNAINAKRVDLLLTDARFAPIAAIEYQGSGHHLGKAAARDAVKKEALRKAGIAFIEITCDHGPDDVRREIGRLAYQRTRDPKDTMRQLTGA